MKYVLAVAFVALTSLALPAAAKPCDENASAALKRPGGFCEMIESTTSLSTPTQNNAAAVAVVEEDEPYNEPVESTL